MYTGTSYTHKELRKHDKITVGKIILVTIKIFLLKSFNLFAFNKITHATTEEMSTL